MTKRLLEVRPAPPRHWVGDGFPVHSMFDYGDDPKVFSPFLLLDYAPATAIPPSTGAPRGVGEHPHRGFETVTIAYQGEIEHRDSAGHRGRIGPGDVQWMTAASGVLHEEKHGAEFTRRGGTLQMVQLWVNLPARLKMSAPRYQDLLDRNIPSVALPGGARARVIAGELLGTRGPARTHTPVDLWDLSLAPGRLELPIADGRPALVLVLEGRLREPAAGPMQLAAFDRTGSGIALEAETASRVLLMSGEPIDEPIAAYGPFVMNTREEIGRAIEEFQAGKFGRLDAN